MNGTEQVLDRPAAGSLRQHLPRAAKLVLELLDALEGGSLIVDLPGGRRTRVGNGPVLACWYVHDVEVFEAVLARGDIGFGEAYMAQCWDTDDLQALLALLARNRSKLGAALHGRVLPVLGARLRHVLKANTRVGARRNIEAHYDLGNAFYALWLDPTMSYSAALYASPEDSLEAAQRRKYRRILQRLGAQPGQRILEIGCGWGGFAETAATEFGCRVLGLTLSPAQLAHATRRMEAARCASRVELALCDYRDVRGEYDHIVSIEMIEAVGVRFWPQYFRQLSDRLAPGGRCLVQSITIADELFPRYRRSTDFIQRHIFPGGMLPSPAMVDRHARRAGLVTVDDHAFGADYARTLAEWHARFVASLPAVRDLGFPQAFIRMWRFYLAYCEAGFRAGDLDVHHFEFVHGS